MLGEHDVQSVLRKVMITRSGAIIIDNMLSCDAHTDGIPLRVVTHAHSDHLIGITHSVRRCRYIIATPLTLDLINVLKGIRIYRKVGINYGVPIKINDSLIMLKRAKHIPGAAQVYYEDPNGITIGYTGDFKIPGTEPLEVDILITEATYGHPMYVRPPPTVIENTLYDLIKRNIRNGPITILGYHGKLQEVMELIRKEFPEIPFIATKRVYEVTKVAIKHGLRISDIWSVESPEGKEIKAYGYYILFDHMLSRRRRGNSMNIYLSGWLFGRPARKINPREYVVAFSDHADFKQLINYIRESRPRIVIIDGTRSSCASIFAHEVTKRLGIRSIVLPR